MKRRKDSVNEKRKKGALFPKVGHSRKKTIRSRGDGPAAAFSPSQMPAPATAEEGCGPLAIWLRRKCSVCLHCSWSHLAATITAGAAPPHFQEVSSPWSSNMTWALWSGEYHCFPSLWWLLLSSPPSKLKYPSKILPQSILKGYFVK